MRFTLKDRHLYGAGAAACAVCCAAPLAGIFGLAGAAATAFTVVAAGLTFAAIVAGVAVGATLLRLRSERRKGCSPVLDGPVDVTISPHP